MYVKGIQCDVCTKLHNNVASVMDDLPDGWMVLLKGNKFKGEAEFTHFCSIHCLNDWVEKQRIASMPKEVENKPIELKIEIEGSEYWKDL